MSYIRNLLESSIKRRDQGADWLQSCFYIFSLKTGCRMIALIEALISGMQIYLSREESHFIDHPYLGNALETLTLLNSLILLMGTELAHIPCLILWLFITMLSKTIDLIIHLMEGIDLTSMFFLCTFLMVASLILKLQDKLRASLTEMEVLYKQDQEV
ncbi:uncharacterized protein [Drosophila kikkawai]|uniref:Uncharacterized protein n=1 Tax=Drosophila kikkawai TaxID=30033 RepID=A0ABM4GC46_DROKI